MARFARVYPVYLLALLLVLPLILKDPSWRSIPQFILLHCWVPFGDLRSLQNINFPGWSLSVEFAFYLLFPLLLAALSRVGRRGLILAAAAACVPMLALRLPSLNAGVIPPFGFVDEVPFMLLRVPEFAYGVALGLLYRRDPLLFRSAWLTPVAVIVTFAALVSTGSPWIAPVAAVLFGILIAAVATNRQSFVSRLLSNRLLLLGGGASYAIYILQFPVRYWIGQVFTGDLNMLGRILYAPALIVISTLVFLYFEEPVREWLRRKVSLPPSQGDKVAGTVAPGQPPAAQAREPANSQ
jgi:peptidoglycan/LPS O-acetylase OafA/YrhL